MLAGLASGVAGQLWNLGVLSLPSGKQFPPERFDGEAMVYVPGADELLVLDEWGRRYGGSPLTESHGERCRFPIDTSSTSRSPEALKGLPSRLMGTASFDTLDSGMTVPVTEVVDVGLCPDVDAPPADLGTVAPENNPLQMNDEGPP